MVTGRGFDSNDLLVMETFGRCVGRTSNTFPYKFSDSFDHSQSPCSGAFEHKISSGFKCLAFAWLPHHHSTPT